MSSGNFKNRRSSMENHLYQKFLGELFIERYFLGFAEEGLGESEAVVALGEDAGEVGEEGVGGDDEVGPPGVPEEEGWGAGEGGPVAEFAAAGFADVGEEVVWVVRGEVFFGERAADPFGAVWEVVFPAADGEVGFVECGGFPFGRGGRGIEPACGEVEEGVGEGELEGGPEGEVGGKDPGGGEFNDHGVGVLSMRFFDLEKVY